MNKVILKGRLARDIELRTTTTGKSVAQSAIAVNRRGKDAGADFIPLVIWGQQAETFSRYLSKGREVLVEGRMQVRNYEDKTGNTRYVTEVIVENFEFCGSKADAGGGAPAGDSYGGGYGTPASTGNPFGASESFGAAPADDVPF